MKAALGSWKSLGIVTASTVTSASLTLGVTLIAVALLEKAEYGHFFFFISVSTLIGAFLDLGVSFQMMMEYSTQPDQDPDTLVGRAWSAQLWSYGLGLLLAITASVPVARYFHVPTSIVLLGALNGVLVGLFNFAIAFLQVRQLWASRARVIIKQGITRAAATIVGLMFGTATAGAIGGLAGALLGLVIALLSNDLAPLVRAFPTLGGIRDASMMWARSRWFVLLAMAASSAEYAPLAYVARVAGAEPLAAFGLATQLAAGPGLALTSIITYLMPSGADPSVSLRDYATLITRAVAPALALFAFAALTAPFLIPAVFGREFMGAVVPFELLLIATAAFVAWNPLQILLFRLRDARSWAVMDLVRVVTLLVGLAVFSNWFSAPIAAGSAVASSAIVSRMVGLSGLLLRRDQLLAPRSRDSGL